MTDPQALDLAKRIMNCWRGGTPLADWVAELARLEAAVRAVAETA